MPSCLLTETAPLALSSESLMGRSQEDAIKGLHQKKLKKEPSHAKKIRHFRA